MQESPFQIISKIVAFHSHFLSNITYFYFLSQEKQWTPIPSWSLFWYFG